MARNTNPAAPLVARAALPLLLMAVLLSAGLGMLLLTLITAGRIWLGSGYGG